MFTTLTLMAVCVLQVTPRQPLLMDTTYSAPGGSTIVVGDGGNFQTALNNANRGDIITLNDSSTYTGNFTLPDKGAGTNYIYIRRSGTLTTEGQRITTGQPATFPKVVCSGTSPAISANDGASYYRFINIEFKSGTSLNQDSVVKFGDGSGTLPHHLIVDRCLVKGDPTAGLRRGVRFYGNYLAVLDSYIFDCKEDGSDSQAMGIFGGSVLKISNNFLEGAGENILIGGVDVPLADIPQNVEIVDNLFSKPNAWNPLHGSYGGVHWTVKNLLELKNCKRALIARNTFTNCWVDGQNGQAILFSSINQGGTAPWSEVSDIDFQYNKITDAAQGITISCFDGYNLNVVSRRIRVYRNEFKRISGAVYGDGFNRLFQVSGGGFGINIDHNTGIEQSGEMLFIADSNTLARFRFTNNMIHCNPVGLQGTSLAEGNTSISTLLPGSVIKKNVFISGTEASYPADNFFPANIGAVDFMNATTQADLRLAGGSAYNDAALDGTDCGADLA